MIFRSFMLISQKIFDEIEKFFCIGISVKFYLGIFFKIVNIEKYDFQHIDY